LLILQNEKKIDFQEKKRHMQLPPEKSKGLGIFDDKKVKNIDIEYRLQSIFPNPAKDTTSELADLSPHLPFKY